MARTKYKAPPFAGKFDPDAIFRYRDIGYDRERGHLLVAGKRYKTPAPLRKLLETIRLEAIEKEREGNE